MRATQHFDSGQNYIFWCNECNVPVLEEKCGICGKNGDKIELSPPGDIRFASPYEKDIIDKLVLKSFSSNPLSGKLILLNKIPGEDKTDEIIVDGLYFGVLRFDLGELEFKLDIMIDGALALINSGINSKTVRISSKGRHLSGKNIDGSEILECSGDIVKGDTVLVTGNNLGGFGISLSGSSDMKQSFPSLKIRKISSQKAAFNSKIPSFDEVSRANAPHMKQLVKDAANTIRGIANQAEFRDSPVYVSFSGGKDSLVTLDLTRKAIKKPVKVFFANTGIEFPETIEFIRNYSKENNLDIIEVEVKEAFWEALPDFGPPAKDFRWCCKVCKLAPINSVIEECVSKHGKCLTIDGKRKYESFARARIAPKEENPFIPGQVSVFPIRNWRAIEVWLYIYFRNLEYNPLYDMGFERVGCWLCPAELGAEYYRFGQLHPELFERWNNYLLEWANENGITEEFIKHGFWRWKTLPPKMNKLAVELGINTKIQGRDEEFGIVVTGGVSPCKSGGYTMEGKVTGLSMDEVLDVVNILGENTYSEDLGVVLVKTPDCSVKIFSSGHISVNARNEEQAVSVFENTAKQLIRVKKCTKCGVCQKVCPADAITLEPSLNINDKCTRCGKCTGSCVVVKYFDKLLPGFRKV
ncbi:MAG: phosphoadenosine phosphosulfate reductase family protein [Candidatus Methanoperedens sp.]|jgi:phosphoadenosine phosphosulfate reductase|nr:phosphoadenosine phosphosulfate reductase family protein [Candidatus Methanoperedens sp.]PKL53405.1 MAG: phosphoadenosine phosphosulfate reductase [Candidatus Methanoperedenaceae archaeon HGW-Methanoperedenaceae-1]